MKSCKERLLHLLSLSVADRTQLFTATDIPDFWHSLSACSRATSQRISRGLHMETCGDFYERIMLNVLNRIYKAKRNKLSKVLW